MQKIDSIKKILVFAVNPKGTSSLRLDEEVREIEAGLHRKGNDNFIVKQQWAVRPIDVRRAMLDFEPNIVHFCGHGTGEEGLVFEDNTGEPKLISSSALSSLFDLFSSLDCVLLNACYSEIQAKEISRHIPYIIGMKQSVGDSAAIEFAIGFYDALVAGKDIPTAFKFGCNAIQMAGIPEYHIPVLYKQRETAKYSLENSHANLIHTNNINKFEVGNSLRRALDNVIEFTDNRTDYYYVKPIHTSEELEILWQIDKAAYGSSSLSLSEFYSWWESFDLGLVALFNINAVIGAYGLWPLPGELASDFKKGVISEYELSPLELQECHEKGSNYWYASGIVLQEELRKPIKLNPLFKLLNIGLNLWIESSLIRYPIEITSLGLSIEGRRMLERFGFLKIRDICHEMSPFPIYALRAKSKYDLITLLKRRGL